MGRPSDLFLMGDKGNAMAAWKERQREKPVQGPPTEIQMLRTEVEALRRQQADDGMAAALTELERNRSRI